MEAEIIGGRYQLGSRLGEGWFGEVYAAHDLYLDYDLAIKLLRKGPGEATSLLREGAYLKALESPYILRVENADIVADIGYLATQLAVAGSTEDHLQPEGMAPDRVLPLMRQALIGLRACHEYGLIHRDIKPANIFLHDRDRVALGDFGAAERMDERGRVPVGGDPRLRPPEMLRGGEGSVRSDIYSAGVTMYRLLTGSWPVEWSDDFAALRARVVGREFEDLAVLAPHVPWTLVHTVRRAMEGNPTDRFSSAEEMGLALGRVDLGRRWARMPAHPGHAFCWVDAPGGSPAREVCLVEVGQKYSISTRRTTGGRSRITQLCIDDVVAARLPAALRRVFTAP